MIVLIGVFSDVRDHRENLAKALVLFAKRSISAASPAPEPVSS